VKILLRSFEYFLTILSSNFLALKLLLYTSCENISSIFINMQLDEHFSKPMKEFVSLCLRKNPAEVIFLFHDSTFLPVPGGTSVHFFIEKLHIFKNKVTKKCSHSLFF
jgi:hypothetical protein